MGRQKRWAERLILTLPEGGKARIDAALRDDEDRLMLIRSAVDVEVSRRETQQTQSKLPQEHSDQKTPADKG